MQKIVKKIVKKSYIEKVKKAKFYKNKVVKL